MNCDPGSGAVRASARSRRDTSITSDEHALDLEVVVQNDDVGRVSEVESAGGDSPAVVVTMKLDEEALPIHEDASVKVRPRIFFEGNLFFDIHPGSPSSRQFIRG